ncbi:MAG TPA: hypothetical protein ENI69_06925 [Rhodospirillales bacterium]|nr:hypothetical protein [Rhodospirillales bacterium]
MDRGLVYVHMLLKFVFGTTSYELLQAFQIFIDALLVFPLMSIAYSLSQNHKIAWSVGLLYGAFLPQAWLAVQPDYNVWLTTGYILATWLYLKIIALAPGEHRWRSLVLYAAALFGVMFAVNQIRSTIILLPIGMAAWWWATTLLTTRSLVFPRRNWPSALALLGVGVLVIGISGALNKTVRSYASPVRSTFGHAFWTGVGQFKNPYGLRDDDGSVVEFYKNETGIEETDSTTGGVAYNAWLRQRAVQFIKKYPVLYASMVARRAAAIIFPNMPFTVVADKPAYDRTPIELARTKHRIELQQRYGKLSPTTISRLISEDPFYVVGLFGRLALMLLLPLGGVLFFVFSQYRALGLLTIVPLAYHVITLSPVYATPIILIPGYAAILPVVGIGWWLALQKSFTILRNVHRAP